MTKEDFYCGSFLSLLLNNGVVPALFEATDVPNRKIYDFSTNKGDFRVYVKYSEKPISESERNGSLWSYPFTDKQIDEINNLHDDSKEIYFVFICGNKKLSNTKIAVVGKEDVLSCIDSSRGDKYKGQNFKIRLIKGEHNFRIYGTARADKHGGQDNTIKVSTKNIDMWL